MRAMLLLTFVVGCGASYNPGLRQDLSRRASFDMNCPEQSLAFTELSQTNGVITSYGVRGCDKQATYVLDGHVWVLNTDGRGHQ